MHKRVWHGKILAMEVVTENELNVAGTLTVTISTKATTLITHVNDMYK